jgi:hypothetical protein
MHSAQNGSGEETVSSGPLITDELRTLIEAAFEDRLDESQRAKLDHLLASDPDACLSYVQYVSTLVGLRRFLAGRPSFVGDIEKSAGGIGESLVASQQELRVPSAAVPTPPADLLSADYRPSRSALSLGFIGECFNRGIELLPRLWLLALVMGVSTLVAFMAVLSVREHDPAPADSGAELAQVAASTDSPPIGLPLETTLSGSGINSLRLASGSAKFWIAGVGWVVAEGPVDFDLLAPLRARLNRGRITVRVTEQSGHGFVVETPDGKVTDLGTEFGLDVSDGNKTSLLVFEGAVDLSLPHETGSPKRLVGGEGVDFSRAGDIARVPYIVRGNVPTFLRAGEARPDAASSLIVEVSDNLAAKTQRFYEIVPGGFRKDAVAFVDRSYQWKRMFGKQSMAYLEGADYVKTFNDDKLLTNSELRVTLAKPARLYVLFDDRVAVPDWLKKDFHKLNERLNLIGYRGEDRVYCRFNVWERFVRKPGVVTLGPCNAGEATHGKTSMYCIAAVPLEARKKPTSDEKKKPLARANPAPH